MENDKEITLESICDSFFNILFSRKGFMYPILDNGKKVIEINRGVDRNLGQHIDATFYSVNEATGDKLLRGHATLYDNMFEDESKNREQYINVLKNAGGFISYLNNGLSFDIVFDPAILVTDGLTATRVVDGGKMQFNTPNSLN